MADVHKVSRPRPLTPFDLHPSSARNEKPPNDDPYNPDNFLENLTDFQKLA